jgi:hypothetical protein
MSAAMIHDPARAKEFFEAKMAFTTGPVELERMMKEGSVVCHLAATAAVQFAAQGFPVMELDGGWRWWKEDGFDVHT